MQHEIGIIGYGGMGQWMEEAFRRVPDLHICGIAEIAADNIRKAEAGGRRVFRDYRQLLEQPLDGVYIASPNHLHKEHVLAAAERKLPIFCEKPLALTLADADEMVAAVQSSGAPGLVNFSLRFAEAHERLRGFLETGQLGELLACWSHAFRGYGFYSAGARHPAVIRPEESGGWVVHHAIHSIDWVLSIGGKVESTAAYTISSTPEAPGAEGIFGVLKFVNGAVGNVSDSVVGYREHSAGIIGTKGTAVYGKDGLLRLKVEQEQPETGEEVCTAVREEGYQYTAARHFASVIAGTALPKATLADGRTALAVALAMSESSRKGTLIHMERDR
jgi:1,5-anhydro-D-fructose reductase (1,5-anhydro-D-mannitol-forming)